jgi:hypothetical protein
MSIIQWVPGKGQGQNVVINPFPADVANKRNLGLSPKSHFCDLTGKTEVIGLSDLMTLFIDLGCLYLHKLFSVFSSSCK